MKLRRVSYHNSPALQSKYICPTITAERGQIKKERFLLGRPDIWILDSALTKNLYCGSKETRSAGRLITSKKTGPLSTLFFTLHKEVMMLSYWFSSWYLSNRSVRSLEASTLWEWGQDCPPTNCPPQRHRRCWSSVRYWTPAGQENWHTYLYKDYIDYHWQFVYCHTGILLHLIR